MGVNRTMPAVIKYLLRTALFFPCADHQCLPGSCVELSHGGGPGDLELPVGRHRVESCSLAVKLGLGFELDRYL